MIGILKGHLRNRLRTPYKYSKDLLYYKEFRDLSIMSVNKEVKGMLARCLATENIVVEHRNVGHLKLVIADEEIVNSGEDISDLELAVEVGEAKLAEDIWTEKN